MSDAPSRATVLSLRPVIWLGDSRERIRSFPETVKDDIGTAIQWAQRGAKHPDAKVMAGFGSAAVVEVVADSRGDTFRAVYTVRFKAKLYVLHCFQKKSKKGIATTNSDLKLIQRRFREAQQLERNDDQGRTR
jgi:phage-related protein